MRKVSIEYHAIKDRATEFPIEYLKILYWSAGIDLHIDKGETIELYESKKWEDLRKKWQDRKDKVGHIILGTHDQEGKGYPGLLVDWEKRGVVILFLEASHFYKDKDSQILQTASHEIGHMLNLSHNSNNSLTSVMDPSDVRDKDKKGFKSTWELVIKEANENAAKGKEPYFNLPAILPPCYPFDYFEREKLNLMDESKLQPWCSEYKPD